MLLRFFSLNLLKPLDVNFVWKCLICVILENLAVVDPGFSPGGAQTRKIAIIFQIFAENCMKMREFGPPEGGGARDGFTNASTE